jgi:minichromosome maintenance protein 10
VANGLEFSGYLSDDGSQRRAGEVDMSVFKNVVQYCLDYEPKPVQKLEN